MTYPGAVDNIPTVPAGIALDGPPDHTALHNQVSTAIIALETKVGTGASTPIAGDVLTSTSNGTSVWAATGTGNVSNTGTPTSGQIAQWTGATVIQGLSTTGSGNVVLATSPTLVTPALGTPASGIATNLTGTASGLTAGNVTTNANLTGPITSSGNTTSIASQTGTGSKFVVDTSPTIVTPTIVENANPVMSLNGNPVWQYLGYAQITSNFTTTGGTTPTAVTGLSVTVTVPTGATKVRITGFCRDLSPTGTQYLHLGIYAGSVTSGNLVGDSQVYGIAGAEGGPASPIAILPASSYTGSRTFIIGTFTSTGNFAIECGSTYPAFILVECC